MIAIAVMIVCGLLVSGDSAMAQPDGRHCSNRTLFGNYGVAVEGCAHPTGSA